MASWHRPWEVHGIPFGEAYDQVGHLIFTKEQARNFELFKATFSKKDDLAIPSRGKLNQDKARAFGRTRVFSQTCMTEFKKHSPNSDCDTGS